MRGDFMIMGGRQKNTTEDGIVYQGRYKLQRVAVFGDGFLFKGSFRLTGGLSSNDYKVTLDASGLNVKITYPSVTPYLCSGWRMTADIGALIGKAKVTATARGALANEADIQANLDKDLA